MRDGMGSLVRWRETIAEPRGDAWEMRSAPPGKRHFRRNRRVFSAAGDKKDPGGLAGVFQCDDGLGDDGLAAGATKRVAVLAISIRVSDRRRGFFLRWTEAVFCMMRHCVEFNREITHRFEGFSQRYH